MVFWSQQVPETIGVMLVLIKVLIKHEIRKQAAILK